MINSVPPQASRSTVKIQEFTTQHSRPATKEGAKASPMPNTTPYGVAPGRWSGYVPLSRAGSGQNKVSRTRSGRCSSGSSCASSPSMSTSIVPKKTRPVHGPRRAGRPWRRGGMAGLWTSPCGWPQVCVLPYGHHFRWQRRAVWPRLSGPGVPGDRRRRHARRRVPGRPPSTSRRTSSVSIKVDG